MKTDASKLIASSQKLHNQKLLPSMRPLTACFFPSSVNRRIPVSKNTAVKKAEPLHREKLAAVISMMAISCSVWSQDDSTRHEHKVNSFEEVIVVAEKRNESLQDISQSVTALTEQSLEKKGIQSFVDLSGIVPGVTVAKNEGFKTVIAIRGVGNEANQNAVANPSVSYHMDGIYIASPFALQTDFIDVSRIEALRGPQGTLFGQNSTGGAINVISKRPSTDTVEGRLDTTVGNYSLIKTRASVNLPVTDTVATRTSVSYFSHDGFSKNILNDQELDSADNFSARSDWLIQLSEDASLRIFGQYFKEDSNGAAIKGIHDPTRDDRKLAQDTRARYQLESQIYAAIAEWELESITLKALGSWQKDDVHIVRDNDRHSYALNPEITISEYAPEINIQTTNTFEINMISSEPLFDRLDWIVGAFYLDTDIEITIREAIDTDGNGSLDGYAESFPDVFAGDAGFISDANPQRESHSLYGQTTYHMSEQWRAISGLRYTKDKVHSKVANFFTPSPDSIKTSTEEVTGRIALEYDISDIAMAYGAYTRGFKPGGSNLTYGDSSDGSPALVAPVYEDETINAYEIGLKADFFSGTLRTNAAVFYYDYENMQFQATDPDIFQGGVANIPESRITGLELELIALLSENWTMDAKLAALESEITEDFEALDNVLAQPYFFGDELIRYQLRENMNGNELAKTPGLTADLSLSYQTALNSNNLFGPHATHFSSSLQYTYRGGFSQRIFNNPHVDHVDAYETVNLTASLEFSSGQWGIDAVITNLFDKDGINSRMTDVFGVSATGEERIAPRQVMARVWYEF